MRTKMMYDGMFEVCEDGTIYIIKNGNKKLARILNTSRDGSQCAVSYYQDGKQKHEYVHRLVAKVFLPNPNNYPCVRHKDGNAKNNHVDNLEWCSRQYISKTNWENGLKKIFLTCTVCGAGTTNKDGICQTCKRKSAAEAKIGTDVEKRASKAREILAEINKDTLTATQRAFVEARESGLTYKEIGDLYGVTSQCVNAAIKAVLHKHDCNKIQSQYLMNKELITLHARIERKRLALKMLEAQIEARRDEIHIIGERIGFIESALQSGTSTAKEAKQ